MLYIFQIWLASVWQPQEADLSSRNVWWVRRGDRRGWWQLLLQSSWIRRRGIRFSFFTYNIYYKWQICIFIQTNLCTQNNRCLDCTRFPDRLKSWACPRVRLLKDHLNGLEEIRFPDRSRPVLIQPGMLGFSATQILWSVSIWWNSTNCLLQARPLDHHCLSVHHGGGLGYSRWRSRHKV